MSEVDSAVAFSLAGVEEGGDGVAEDVAYLKSSGAGALLERLAKCVVTEKPADPVEGLLQIATRIKEEAVLQQTSSCADHHIKTSPAARGLRASIDGRVPHPPGREGGGDTSPGSASPKRVDSTSEQSQQRASLVSLQSEETEGTAHAGETVSVVSQGQAREVSSIATGQDCDQIACQLDTSVCNPTHVNEISVVVVAKDDVGNKMINQYAVVSELGRGQYGKVKLVMHTPTKKYFAIKIMNKSVLSKARKGTSGEQAGRLAGAKTALDSALQEIAIMKRLDHPNVCKLYEVINDPTADKMYLILEYMEGGPVFVLKEGCKPLPIERLTPLFVGISQGLDYLHQIGIIHRDVKPENILLDKDGRPMLTDFGVSNEDMDGANVRDTSGTPAFFPPELFLGTGVTGRAVDVWALGVTFYVLACARTPFGGRNLAEVCNSVTKLQPDYDLVPDPGLKDLLQQMLTKDTEKRLGVVHGVEDILLHPFIKGADGAERRSYRRIVLTEEEKNKAVLTGANIQLKLMNTVGAMMKIKAKFGKGPQNRPIPDSIAAVRDEKSDEGIPKLGSRLSANMQRNTSGGEETQSLRSRKSFKTEEEVTMESHHEGALDAEVQRMKAEEWEDLTLSCYKFDKFPDALFECAWLVNLTAHHNGLKEISPQIDHFQMLVTLNLGQNELTSLPDELGFLSSLEMLDVNRNLLESVPDTLSELTELKYINLDFNNLSEIPTCLCEITDLEQCFMIENEKIKSFPAEEMQQWSNCRVAVDNAPVLKQEWVTISKQLPNVNMMWHKLYPDQVNDYLFVGSLRTVQSEKVIRELNIEAIVTAGKGLEILDPLPAGVSQLALNVDDIPEQSMTPVFDEVIEFIDAAKRASKRVIVHCFAGLSRSVTCVCAYLMKQYNMTFKESIALVKQARPNSNPNDGFRRQLIQYEKFLHGTQIDPEDPECRANQG